VLKICSLGVSYLPSLTVGRTTNHSICPERISAELMHPWYPSRADILVALRGLDLSANVSHRCAGSCRAVCSRKRARLKLQIYSQRMRCWYKGSFYFNPVPCSTGRYTFVQLSATLSIHSPARVSTVVAAGELKTFWTVKLENYPVISGLIARRNLERHIHVPDWRC
jgi:hypothetical protein